MRLFDLVHHLLICRAANMAESLLERVAAHVFGQVARGGMMSVSSSPAARRCCTLAGIRSERVASSPKRVPARSAAMSVKLNPEPLIGVGDLLEQADGIGQGAVAACGQRGRGEEVLAEILAAFDFQPEGARSAALPGTSRPMS